MKKVSMLLCLSIFLLLIFIFAGCAPDDSKEEAEVEEYEETEEEEPLPAEALIEDRCTQCHGLDRVHVEKSKEEWPEIVERMVDQSPGLLDDEEFDVVVDYLQENYGN